MKILETLWPYPQEINIAGEFKSPLKIGISGETYPEYLLEDLKSIAKLEISEDAEYPLNLNLQSDGIKPEGYRLSISSEKVAITAADKAGLSYGIQTFLQIAALCGKNWPSLEINDWPAYSKRCFMVDMGRSIYTMPMLKRMIRILHRLKMNQLHLHLYNDELCGLRFKNLPFGHDNPASISMENLAELVSYAKDYHVEIVPELEAWGHAGSIVYHRKDLRGGKGVYEGSSFLIGKETFSLMEQMIEEVLDVMPAKSTIHLGLDEAEWFTDSSLSDNFAPTDMVRTYHDILHKLGEKHKKSIDMRIWADHAGRPVPEDIQEDIIIEPWQYWKANYDAIDKAIARYQDTKMRIMAGAGGGGRQYRGAYHATRYWAKKLLNAPNAYGINITHWCWNDIDRKFISLFAGAYFCWNPMSPAEFADIEDYEDFDRNVFPIMYKWQGTFKDADPVALQRDRGPTVFNGFYQWDERHGQAVSPTALAAGTVKGFDYVSEPDADI